MKRIYITFFVGYIINIFIVMSGIEFLAILLTLGEMIYLYYAIKKLPLKYVSDLIVSQIKLMIALIVLTVMTNITNSFLNL